jgi:hypothetical protein
MKPLSLTELAAALNIQGSQTIYAEQRVHDRVKWCKSLIKVQQSRKSARMPVADLVHYSVKEYLAKPKDQVDLEISHLKIAAQCVEYLHRHLANAEYWFCDDERATERLPLIPYATRYWSDHTRYAGIRVMELFVEHEEFFGEGCMAYSAGGGLSGWK